MTTNTFRTNAEISNEALRILTNWLKFSRTIKHNYSDKFGVGGNKIGDTYTLRLPVQYKFATGSAFQAQGIQEKVVPITLENWVNRSLQMSTEDLTLSIDMFSDRIIKPAMVSAANQIDNYNLKKASEAVFNAVGTPGSSPTDAVSVNNLVGSLAVRLADSLATEDMQTLITTPAFAQLAAALNVNVFNDQSRIGEQNLKGFVANAMGFDWYRTQIMPSHTNGNFSGSPKVDGDDQSGSELVTKSWGVGSTLNVGDRFTINGVYAVNAQTKQPYSYLQQFVVTAASAASTTKTVKISPAMVGPEDPQYQNVSALPADDAAINMLGVGGATFEQNLGFDEDAFGVAYARFAMPKAGMGVISTVSADDETGINITYTAGYDIRDFSELHRLDLLSAFVAMRPQLGGVIVR